MDNLIIFGPFPEKIEESGFSILRVKGRALKLENGEYIDLWLEFFDENWTGGRQECPLCATKFSSILGKKWIYCAQYLFQYLGAQNRFFLSTNLDENWYAYHCCVKLLSHNFSAKFHKSCFIFGPKTDFGLFLTVFWDFLPLPHTKSKASPCHSPNTKGECLL